MHNPNRKLTVKTAAVHGIHAQEGKEIAKEEHHFNKNWWVK